MSDDKRGSSNEPSWLYEENDNTLEEKLVTEVNSNNNNTNNDNDDSIFDKSKTYTGSSSTNNKDKYSSGRVPSTEQKLKWKKPSTESLNFSYSNNINSADYEDCCCCPSDPVLLWFRFFHFVSTIISIATLISNITIITKPEITPIDIIMHVYAMLFCIAIIFIEIDWRFVMDRVRVMDLWMFRGLFYCFVGIITVEKKSTVSTVPEDIIAMTLVVVGIIYFCMGILCVKSIAIKRMQKAHATTKYSEIADDFV